MKTFVFVVISLFFSLSVSANADLPPNFIGVGQGISSPSQISTLNFSNGYTHENPVGVSYLRSMKITGEYVSGANDGNGDFDGFGAEFGYGNGMYGFALGYFDYECDGCDGHLSGALAGNFGSVAVGVGGQEGRYSAGVIISPLGQHRIGIVAELSDPDGNNLDGSSNNSTRFGAGYSYVDPMFTVSVDASMVDHENSNAGDADVIWVTPGVSLRFNMFEATVSYNAFLEKDDASELDDGINWGIGFGDPAFWHVAIYNDYVREWAGSVSFFF